MGWAPPSGAILARFPQPAQDRMGALNGAMQVVEVFASPCRIARGCARKVGELGDGPKRFGELMKEHFIEMSGVRQAELKSGNVRGALCGGEGDVG